MSAVFADWLDFAQYPDPTSAGPSRWAWEFLRRNPEYQADYERVVRPLRWSEFGEPLDMDYWHADPPAKPGESETEYRGRIGAAAFRLESRYKAFLDRWGMLAPHHLPAPECGEVPSFSVTAVCSISPNQEVEDGQPRAVLSAETARDEKWVRFNLSHPLKPQIERALRMLEMTQQHLEERGQISVLRGRNHIEKLPAYLRLLDAEAAGASPREMAAAIFPKVPNKYPEYSGQKRVRDGLAAAKRIRDGDWTLLLA